MCAFIRQVVALGPTTKFNMNQITVNVDSTTLESATSCDSFSVGIIVNNDLGCEARWP